MKISNKAVFILFLLLSACSGKDGEPGKDGVDGEDGVNGVDGRNGIDGTIFESVDPCGNGPGPDEIVLVFSDGTIMAWYKNLGLNELQEGTIYVTTDKQRCKFSIVKGKVIEL